MPAPAPDAAAAAEAAATIASLEETVATLRAELGDKDKQLHDLGTEHRALKQQTENSATEGKEHIAALAKEKAAVASLNRRVAETEAKVAELNDMLESLTLDKEQLTIEKEEAEEAKIDAEAKLGAAEQQLELQATAPAGGGAEGADAAGADSVSLQEQNSRLRAALQKLHELSSQEKAELQKQVRGSEKDAAAKAALEKELALLQQWKAEAGEELQALHEVVDTGSAHEAMIDSLTEKNLDLNAKVSELQVALDDMETEKELADELEEQQSAEIKTILAQLDEADAAVANAEAKAAALQEQVAKHETTIGRLRQAATSLREERDTLSMEASHAPSAAAAARAQSADGPRATTRQLLRLSLIHI